MTAAEQAVLSALSAEGKAAVKALLKDVIDVEIPAIEAAEAAKLPLPYAPIVNGVFSSLYPQLEAALDARIAAI